MMWRSRSASRRCGSTEIRSTEHDRSCASCACGHIVEGHVTPLRDLHRPHPPVVYRAHGLAHRGWGTSDCNGAGRAGTPGVGSPDYCGGTRVGWGVADRVLHRGQRAVLPWIHPHAGPAGPWPVEIYTSCRPTGGILERRIYLAVGINISLASVLVLVHSGWWLLFTGFVGTAMVWFAATGFCIMANGLYWLGAEPRLAPEKRQVPNPAAASGTLGPA